MSSISKMELDRIIEQRLSPQYVSVHATDPEVRRYLLGRKRPDDVLGKMRYLADHGIELHAQVVLCPTINDGEALRRTVYDLAELHPSLTSVAIVPVVFTKLHNYRDRMTAVTDDYARGIIKEARAWQREFRNRLGSTFVFLADEFYLRAGVRLPGRAHYGDYPQIEDGVGMVRRFIIDSERTLRRDLSESAGVRRGSLHGTIATGELFYPALAGFVSELNERWGMRLKVVALKNHFFGEEITVAGLMAGGDVLAARESIEGNFLIVPEQACLKGGHIFLDDTSLEDLERELNIPVSHGGGSLMSMIERAVGLESRALTETALTEAALTDEALTQAFTV
jgi:putative radical SAM enzyme (TIGR03279 family)